MTIFKYFFKVMNEYKGIILLYTGILIFFAGFNLSTGENTMSFVAEKPDVLLIDHDNSKYSNNLKKYLEENANLKDLENKNDALFYRDVSLIIEIPEGYYDSIKNNKLDIEIKSTNDAEAEYGKMLLERYLKISLIYEKENLQEDELIEKINQNIKITTEVNISSKLDSETMDKATFYYNFANYSLLAGCVFVISTTLNSFKNINIKKRTMISSYNYKKYNKNLFLAGSTYGIVLWILYTLISFILLKDVMFTINGLLYLINSFIFMLCSVSIAFFMGSLITDKEALNSIVNVVALGSSFLCGAFVPMNFLPDSVLKIAQFLPSYWFIKNNELIKTVESISQSTLNDYIFNLSIVIIFIIIISIGTNIISKKKQKTN